MRSALWPLIVLLLVGGPADASAASVTLAWDGVPGVLYRVYYGTKPGVYTQSVDAKERHTLVIDGLADNQVYYFAVRAYDKTGQMSPFSSEIRKLATQSPPADRIAPRAPPVVSAGAPRNATAAPLSVLPPTVRKDPAPATVPAPTDRKETSPPAAAPPPIDRKEPVAATVPPPTDRKEPAPATVPAPVDRKETSPPVAAQPPHDVKTDAKPDVKADVNAKKETGTAGANGAPTATPASPPPAARVPSPTPPRPPATVASGPPGYLIGPNDVLSVTFWRDKDMSVDNVVVRPDGNISLPLLNDIQAAGSTPEQLRDRILEAAQHYLEDPSPTVSVKEIHSRNVFITGQVEKPGAYSLSAPMTVLQLIATAGGLKEFADGKNIVVMRSENGRQVAYQFDYREVLKRRNFRQNIDLKPGDTVVVP